MTFTKINCFRHYASRDGRSPNKILKVRLASNKNIDHKFDKFLSICLERASNKNIDSQFEKYFCTESLLPWVLWRSLHWVVCFRDSSVNKKDFSFFWRTNTGWSSFVKILRNKLQDAQAEKLKSSQAIKLTSKKRWQDDKMTRWQGHKIGLICLKLKTLSKVWRW